MADKRTGASKQLQEYEAGRPARIEDTVSALVTAVTRLALIDLAEFLPGGKFADGGDGGNGGGVKTPQPVNVFETPDTGPFINVPNYKAKILAIGTDFNGKYTGTTLEALVAVPGTNLSLGKIFILRNPNWESEFKRAQSAKKLMCLRIGRDGKVQAIEVLD